ncbi:MAG: phosphoribosylglycinamide formyltransferase [Gammaproteobacteria bacterium]|jgi:phosphoribosylglycinamide formyltransferase-1|nr:phosphoribosylglycinamide formyltransferase [Gammaproteobacteria bacterium]
MSQLVLAVLISGSGSNLQAIIDAIEAGTLNARIACVLSNNPDAYGLQRATRHRLPVEIIDHRSYPSREQYDAELRRRLEAIAPDYIVLAGYMRILSAEFVRAFEHRILNIHPALLPAYKGLDTHQRALDNGETEHGVSIHLVTAELDDGPVLLQASYPIENGDSVADLRTRGQRLEHQMYPTVLRWISENKLIIDDHGQIHHDQTLLDNPLQFSA